MTVALLHALPLDERMWAPQREAVREEGAVAPRLYDLGRSMDEWANGVLGLVDGPLAVVGASMGGYAALAIARAAPERVTGVLLAGARAAADPPERRAARDRQIARVREGGAEALWEELRPDLLPEDAPPAVVEHAWGLAELQDPEGLVRAVEAIRDRPDSTEVVRSLAVPLLVVVGERDPLLPLEEARRIADAAPRGRLEVVGGAGHLPSLERDEAFNALLSRFLAELT